MSGLTKLGATEDKMMSEKPDLKNGAYCNKYGSIYLRIVSHDSTQPGWPKTVTDHGLSIEEAHCVVLELAMAITKASAINTGRDQNTRNQ